MPFRFLRSTLFVPGSNARAIEKARSLDADAIIFDLEDSVSYQAKVEARERVSAEIVNGGFAGKQLIVRVNPTGSAWIDDDVTSIIAAGADSILVPKVEDPSEIRELQSRLSENGISGPSIWAMIETAKGILNVRHIAAEASKSRLKALVVGPNDIVRTTRIEPGEGRRNLRPWLLEIVLSGRAYGLSVLDGVFNRLDDEGGFLAECRQGRELGFDGKTLIHPKQIAPANQAFSPTASEIEWSRKVVAAFEAMPADDQANVINLDGEMVERLHLSIARRVLDVIEGRGD